MTASARTAGPTPQVTRCDAVRMSTLMCQRMPSIGAATEVFIWEQGDHALPVHIGIVHLSSTGAYRQPRHGLNGLGGLEDFDGANLLAGLIW